MKILKDFVKEIRKFGIRKASILSGVSYETIYNWTFRGKSPLLTTAQKVANAMGLEFLLFDMLEE